MWSILKEQLEVGLLGETDLFGAPPNATIFHPIFLLADPTTNNGAWKVGIKQLLVLMAVAYQEKQP